MKKGSLVEEKGLSPDLFLRIVYFGKENVLRFVYTNVSMRHFLVRPLEFTYLEGLKSIFATHRVTYVYPYEEAVVNTFQVEAHLYDYKFHLPGFARSNVIVEEKSYVDGRVFITGVYFSDWREVVLVLDNQTPRKLKATIKLHNLKNLILEDKNPIERTFLSGERGGFCVLEVRDPKRKWGFDYHFGHELLETPNVLREVEVYPGVFVVEQIKKKNEIWFYVRNMSKTLKYIGSMEFEDLSKFDIITERKRLFVSCKWRNKKHLLFVLRKKSEKQESDYNYTVKIADSVLLGKVRRAKHLEITPYYFGRKKSILMEVYNPSNYTYSLYMKFTQLVNCDVAMFNGYSHYKRARLDWKNRAIMFCQLTKLDQTKPMKYNYICLLQASQNLSDVLKRNRMTRTPSGSFEDGKMLYKRVQLLSARQRSIFTADDEVISPEVQAVIERKKMFVDMDFLPEHSSIYPKEGWEYDEVDYGWVQARMFMSDNAMIFYNDIEIDDILQGRGLGNCWLLAAVACMALYPNLIKKLFITEEVNSAGIYELQMCLEGRWTRVCVDSFFPVIKGTMHPVFGRNHDSELWAMLIEKAYSKVNGCYMNLHEGSARNAFRDLTGCPSVSIEFKKMDFKKKKLQIQFHQTICIYLQANYLITGVTHPDIDERKGLVGRHFYTVVSAQKYEEILLVNIRNPWGYFEWTGDFGDKSDKWSPHLKSVFGHMDKDDGRFWIPMEDFMENFAQITVCKTDEHWNEQRRTFDCFKGKKKNFELHFEVKAERARFIAGLHQPDMRYTKGMKKYVKIAIKVVKIKKIGLNYTVTEMFGDEQSVDTDEVILSAGKYKIVPVLTKAHHGRMTVSVHITDKDLHIYKLVGKWWREK